MPTIGVAIALPEPWASDLQDYRTALGDETATLIPTHITLVPPVELSEDQIVAAEEHLVAVAGGTHRFEIHLRGTGTFRPVSPVVFVSLVEGISQCEALAERYRQGPLDVPLQFPFHPHVTIAHHLTEDVLDRAFEELAGFDCTFEAGEFHLYRHDEEIGWRPSRDFALAHDMTSPRNGSRRCAPAAAVVDHAVRMVQHYGAVKGNLQAGAVTYFGFLSFFPILALAFFVVGYVSKVYEDARDVLVTAINGLFASNIQLDLSAFEENAATAGVIGLAGVLYAGLGWLSAMREALIVVFEEPVREQPNFVVGKLRDLMTLTLIGITLMVSVAVTGFVSGFATDLLGWLTLDEELAPGHAADRGARARGQRAAVLHHVRAPRASGRAAAAVLGGAVLGADRLRAAQAALVSAARLDPGLRGVPSCSGSH